MESEESKIICKGCKKSVNKVSIRRHLSKSIKKGCKKSYTSEELDAFQNEAELRIVHKKLERKQIKRGTANQSLGTDDTRVICKVCLRPFTNLFMHLERDKKDCKNGYSQEDLTTLENDRKRKRDEYKAADKRARRSSQSEPEKKKQRHSKYLAEKLKNEICTHFFEIFLMLHI